MFGSFPAFATAVVPAQVINSCLKTESTRVVRYAGVTPASFTTEDDAESKRTATTVMHGRHKYGIWESTDSSEFGLVYDSETIPETKIVRTGSDAPAPFNLYTAQWGEAQYGKHRYLCITFNFEGLGQSGSFQNIRGTYAIDLQKSPRFYFAMGDIRKLKN
jgi:hypothetical protein